MSEVWARGLPYLLAELPLGISEQQDDLSLADRFAIGLTLEDRAGFSEKGSCPPQDILRQWPHETRAQNRRRPGSQEHLAISARPVARWFPDELKLDLPSSGA